MVKLLHWFLRRHGYLDASDKIVRVKSWLPRKDRHGIGWPVMSIDTRAGRRIGATPIWFWRD